MRNLRLCVAAAAVACSSAVLYAEQPSNAELAKEVGELRAQVAEMKAQQFKSSADTAKTIDALLRDAEQRSQLLATNGELSAGYDNGFFIQAGAFKFHPWVQFQFRDVTNYREDSKSSGGSDTQNGFEARRVKIGFDGTLWTKDLTYTFVWATNRADSGGAVTDSTGNTLHFPVGNGGAPILEEAWFRYMFADQWGVRLGQIKDPFAHEGLMSSKKQMAAERSYIDDVMGLGDNFVQGVSLIYQQDMLHAELAFTDGTKSANTNFQEPPASNANWGVAGRAEFKVMGNWKDYDDFSAMGTKDNLLVIGGGFDWTQYGNTDVLLHTVDGQFEMPSGLGLYAAYMGRWTNNNDSGSSDFYDWGALVQASYLFTPQWEVFGRYDYTHFDKDSVGDNNEVHEIAGGINYYFHSHNAKLTIDLTWLPKGAPFSDTSGDILSTSGDKDEVVLRGQFQLVI